MIKIEITITETRLGLTLDGGVTQAIDHTVNEDAFSKAVLNALHPNLTQRMSAHLQVPIYVIERHGE